MGWYNALHDMRRYYSGTTYENGNHPALYLHTGEFIKDIFVYFRGKYNFGNNFVNFSCNVTKFGMLIDNIEVDMSYDFGCDGNILAGNYEFLIYQNVCIYKLGWCSIKH